MNSHESSGIRRGPTRALPLLLAVMAVGLWSGAARADTDVSVSLLRSDAPGELVASAERGSVVLYSNYRGPVTTWAFDLSVDGKHFFDERDAQGRFIERRSSLNVKLADGEHRIEPVGYGFRITDGKIESLSPQLSVAGQQVALRLYPVQFAAAGCPNAPVHISVAAPGGELFRSVPGTWAAPLTVYLPAAPPGGYTTNVSSQLLRIDDQAATWVAAEDKLAAEPAAQANKFAVQVPAWRLTTVLLLDRAAENLALQLSGREEATQTDGIDAKIGNWDPRSRITVHDTLTYSRAGWTFSTGVHQWALSAADQTRFRQHVFLVDRPLYHAPGGKEKERVLHIALATDDVTPGRPLPAFWHWIGQKGVDAAPDRQLVAFLQQAPALADDYAGWRALEIKTGDNGEAALIIPPTLAPGRAWLRVGLPDDKPAAATDRLLAELPLFVRGGPLDVESADPATQLAVVAIGAAAEKSRVPDAWRQGVFVEPQSVTAIDLSDDGDFVGVTTMAFRHEPDFWLLSGQGQLLWGRHVDPWAPMQAAVLDGGKTCGVGLAYSRFTDPMPTVSVFQGPRGDETPLVDAFWDLGWLRYGEGDWHTGWPASLMGDLFVRAGGSLFTICSHDGARRFTADGRSQSYPLSYQRPLRMAASADGHVLAFGYLTPDANLLDEKTRNRMRLPPAHLLARNALTSAELWTARPDAEAALLPKLPEAADDFPELAADFNIKPLALMPFRAALSVALNGDGTTTAVTEYGGWLRIKRERGIGSWNPDHPVAFCPRQRGRLRVFDARGAAVAQADLPAPGLFDVCLDRQGQTAWCAPAAWFARGLAGRSWLPADPDAAHSVFAYDLRSKSWCREFQFPDAVSEIAVHPDGRHLLIACWNGQVYLVDRDGAVQAEVDVGDASRVRWSRDGRTAIVGTQKGEVISLDASGRVRWRQRLPVAELPPTEPLKPVFADVPVYAVGRTGTEHAYVGDTWLVKAPKGALLVDTGGASGIPLTWQKLRAAGVEPDQVRHVLLTHSHGDHAGTAYLWRTLGAKIVAPESASLTLNWLMPTWTDYSIWVPALIDMPLPLKRVGDEAEFTLGDVKIRAVFVPGHSFDSVIYLLELGGKRVAFTGDIGFGGDSHILHRCWGDTLKAQGVLRVVREKIIAFRPVVVFTGHDAHQQGTAFLEDLVKRTEVALGGVE